MEPYVCAAKLFMILISTVYLQKYPLNQVYIILSRIANAFQGKNDEGGEADFACH